MKRVNFVIPEQLYEEFRKAIKNKYATDSEAFRDAVRMLIKNLEKESFFLSAPQKTVKVG